MKSTPSGVSMKRIRVALALVALASCSKSGEGPDIARVGDTLEIHGMALGQTATGSAERNRQVEGCEIDETLARITGPTDYCRLRKTEFFGRQTTSTLVRFGDGRLSSLHINAPSSLFARYAASLTYALGAPTSPKPDTQGNIPPGEANTTDGEGRNVVGDYRIWRTPVAHVSLYEAASGKTGQLALVIQTPSGPD